MNEKLRNSKFFRQIFELHQILTRYFPHQLWDLLRSTLVPFKRRSYFSDYLRLWNLGDAEEETRQSYREIYRQRQCLWWQVNALLGYTVLLYFAQFCIALARDRVSNVEMWRLVFCDIIYYILRQDSQIQLTFALLTILAIYFNYRSYRKIDFAFLILFDRIVFRRAGWLHFFPGVRFLGVPIDRLVRIFPLAIVNAFYGFILAYDISLSIIIVSKFISFFGESQFVNWHLVFDASQIMVWLACAINFVPFFGSILLYAHFCILQATIGMIGYFAIYVRISQNQIALRAKHWSSGAITRFERFNVGSIEVFAVANRAFANIFLAFLLCTAPVNVFFVIVLSLNRINLSVEAQILIYALIGHQVLAIFGFHCSIAKLSKRFHRSGRLLSGLFARNQLIGSRRRIRESRFALRVSLIIARLHVKRRYGILYARIALVSMPLFVKFVLLYGEFWMFLYQQIRELQ